VSEVRRRLPPLKDARMEAGVQRLLEDIERQRGTRYVEDPATLAKIAAIMKEPV
jgi:hypothetical protein